ICFQKMSWKMLRNKLSASIHLDHVRKWMPQKGKAANGLVAQDIEAQRSRQPSPAGIKQRARRNADWRGHAISKEILPLVPRRPGPFRDKPFEKGAFFGILQVAFPYIV